MSSWTQLTNFDNGFVDENGNFEVQAVFSVIGKTNAYDLDDEFLDSGFVRYDCTLLVQDYRFPINKGFLSSFSNYFNKLFFGDFLEKNQDEIKLRNVCAEEFLHLLETIYSSVDIQAKNEELMRCLIKLDQNYF